MQLAKLTSAILCVTITAVRFSINMSKRKSHSNQKKLLALSIFYNSYSLFKNAHN